MIINLFSPHHILFIFLHLKQEDYQPLFLYKITKISKISKTTRKNNENNENNEASDVRKNNSNDVHSTLSTLSTHQIDQRKILFKKIVKKVATPLLDFKSFW